MLLYRYNWLRTIKDRTGSVLDFASSFVTCVCFCPGEANIRKGYECQMDRLPSEMSLIALQNSCWWEMEKISRQEPSAEEYCLEIFHRALVLRDEQAWEVLIQRFSATIVGWLRRHPYREEATRLHIQERDYADLTMARLWMTARNRPLEFRSLAGALWFLHKTLNAAAIDTIREMKSKQLPIPPTGFLQPPPLHQQQDTE